MNIKKQTTTASESVTISYAHGEADFSDLVHVVRCKDCKYSSPNGAYGCVLKRFSAHDKSERLYSEDYCSCGERKDG